MKIPLLFVLCGLLALSWAQDIAKVDVGAEVPAVDVVEEVGEVEVKEEVALKEKEEEKVEEVKEEAAKELEEVKEEEVKEVEEKKEEKKEEEEEKKEDGETKPAEVCQKCHDILASCRNYNFRTVLDQWNTEQWVECMQDAFKDWRESSGMDYWPDSETLINGEIGVAADKPDRVQCFAHVAGHAALPCVPCAISHPNPTKRLTDSSNKCWVEINERRSKGEGPSEKKEEEKGEEHKESAE